MRRWMILWSCVLLLLGYWEWLSRSDPTWATLLPAPTGIARRLYKGSDRFWLHTAATLQEIMGGFAIAVAVAFPLAWMMVRWHLMRWLLQPFLVIMQALPMFALAPLMILWFDWSFTAIVIPTALMIFFPLTIAIYRGLDSTSAHLIDYFKMHQATEWQVFWKLRLPGAWPQICSGLRVSAAIAGVGAVAGEWAGAQEGLGMLMMESRRSADFETTFAALCCLKLLSVGLYGIIVGISKLTDPRVYRSWKRALQPVAVGCALVLLAGCSQRSNEGRPLRLMLDWLPNPNHVPLYVGVQKGFFAEEGVPLKILKIQDPSDIYPFLSSGQADLGISYMTYLIQAASHGTDARAVGYLIKRPMNSFIFRKELHIQSVADLGGKVIAASPDDFMVRALEFLLHEKQIVPAARRKVGFDLTSALITGKVDVLYNAFWNIEGAQLQALGLDVDHLLVNELGLPWYFELIVVAPTQVVMQHAGLSERLKKALQRCVDFCVQNPDEAFALYQEANPDKSSATLDWERRAWAMTWPVLAQNQSDERQVWQYFLDWMSENRLLDNRVELHQLLL